MADRFLLKQFAGQADNNGVFGSAQQGQGQVVSDLKQVQSLNSLKMVGIVQLLQVINFLV